MKATLPIALVFATVTASATTGATPNVDAAITLQGERIGLHLRPTQDDTLNVTLLPNTPYMVTATVSTDDVDKLLALLQNGQSPLQILDQAGHLLGSLSAQDLTDAFTGLTGAASKDVSVLLDQADAPVNGLVARTVKSPLLRVTSVRASRDHRPRVVIRRTKQRGARLIVHGRAIDDGRVKRVEVLFRGHLRIAAGNLPQWHATVPLKEGRNHIRFRAIDNANQLSPVKRLTVTR